jgi:hypothetical protein
MNKKTKTCGKCRHFRESPGMAGIGACALYPVRWDEMELPFWAHVGTEISNRVSKYEELADSCERYSAVPRKKRS